MYTLGEDMVYYIYSRQQKAIELDKWRDREYAKYYTRLNECIENLRKELNPSQEELMENLISAMRTFNDYNEFRRFGNGMRCMHDFSANLKENY